MLPLRRQRTGAHAEDSNEVSAAGPAVATFPQAPITTFLQHPLDYSGYISAQSILPDYGPAFQGQDVGINSSYGAAASFSYGSWMERQPGPIWQQSQSFLPTNSYMPANFGAPVQYPEFAPQMTPAQFTGFPPVLYGQPFARCYDSSNPVSQTNRAAPYVAPVLQPNTLPVHNSAPEIEHLGAYSLRSGYRSAADANLYNLPPTGISDNFNFDEAQYWSSLLYDPNIESNTVPSTMTPANQALLNASQSNSSAQNQQQTLHNDEQFSIPPAPSWGPENQTEPRMSPGWLMAEQYSDRTEPRFTPSSSEDSTADAHRRSEGRESSWEVLSRELSTRESSGDVVVIHNVRRTENNTGTIVSRPEADTNPGPAASRRRKAASGKPAVLKAKKSEQRVRGKLTEEQKKNTKLMRQTGTCLRCRVFNEKCNTGTPCDRCMKALSDPRTYHDPCYRDKLDQITTARRGNNNFGQPYVKFEEYIWVPNVDVKTIDIKWSLPGGRSVDLPGLRLDCKQFVPHNNETKRHWITWQVNGEVVTVKLPPYAGENNDMIMGSVKDFLRRGTPAVLDYIAQDVEDKGDDFGALSLREAMRYADKNPDSTVDLALRIRSASYCSQGWGTIFGPETLGIGEFDFNEKGECGYSAYDRGQERPLPLSIDHQIDVALLTTIKLLQGRLIRTLAGNIFRKKGRKPWYEIFLTIYVLLSNLEYVHFGSLSFLRAQMKTQSEQSCEFLTREMVAEYKYSAENLLYHFRAILRAQYGFKAARKDLAEFVEAEKLDAESAQYVQRVLETLDARKLQPRVSPQPAGDVLHEPPPDGRWLNKLFETADTGN